MKQLPDLPVERRQYATLPILLMMIALVIYTGVRLRAEFGVWLRAQRQQYALNRQLIAALNLGDSIKALALVTAGADPNTPYAPPRMPTLPNLWTPWLRHSIYSVDHSPTALLLACGVTGNQIEPTFDVPPQLAIEVQDHNQRDLLLLQAMLAHGAIVNAQDKDHRTPLMWAARFNRPDEVRLLIEHGASVNAQDKEGRTALMTAVYDHVSLETVCLLLDHGAYVNKWDTHGATALSLAVWYSVDRRCLTGTSSDIVQQLLAHGAAPNLADNDQRTPLMIAQDFDRPDIAALLRRYGARE